MVGSYSQQVGTDIQDSRYSMVHWWTREILWGYNLLIWLVVWNMFFFIIYGMSSFPADFKSIKIQDGHIAPPTRFIGSGINH